jgi:hypothetical protein
VTRCSLPPKALPEQWNHSSLSNNRTASFALSVRGRHALYFGKGVPIIKYEFLAFDQKTYHGETGWGARSLPPGPQITASLYACS